MAEKNTHSILETIKKKLQKFDEKPEKGAKIADVSDEFEYIAPAKKSDTPVVENKTEVKAEEKKVETPKVEAKSGDDLDFGDLNKSTESAPAAPSAPAPQAAASNNKLDDFNLDDLDLDDESNKSEQAPTSVAQQSAPVDANQDNAEFSENDIEDYEDEVDFSEEEEAVAETHQVEKDEDDLDLEDLAQEDEEESDELNLEEETPAEEQQEEELNLEEETNPEEQQEEELNLEEEIPAAEQPTAAASEEDAHDLHVEEDFNLDEELNAEEDENELNLEQEEEAQTETVQAEESHDLEDLNLDEAPKENLEQAKPQEAKANAIDDLELEALEKELEEQQKKQEEAQKPKAVAVQYPSAKDEIDLEFEKELMGFKPEKSATKVEEKIAQPKVEAAKSAPMSMAESAIEEDVNEDNNILFGEENIPEVKADKTQLSVAKNSTIGGMAITQENLKLINDTTIAKTTESIKKLVDAKNVISGVTNFSQSPALQDLAIQLMEPKLEKWFNDNLPEIVEKVVREEIKKIVPREE